MSEETESTTASEETTTSDLLKLSEHTGQAAKLAPTEEEIAKLAYHLWELRKDDPNAVAMTEQDDWRRAEAILRGDAGMGQLEGQ